MSTKLGFKKALVKSQAAGNKKAVSIFSAMSVAHVDDEEPGTGEVRTVEKVLPNGEFYSGQCCDGLPYGQGKYLWNDGCMYVGEWSKGNTMGIGMFSWPCGAAYEGDFKAGFMDGNGTYTSSSGDTYKGSWSMNFRQGQGTQSYANGDCYEGEWSKGCQNGHGKYQWENGNIYSGQWRNGMMNGNGTMVWLNGNRYDGYWEDGFPSGNGKFRWADGSFYVGFWSKVADEQSGTYYPSGSPAEDLNWDPQQVFLEDLKDCKICSTEEVSIFASHKKPHSPGSGKWSDRRPSRASERRLSNYSWNSDTNELSSNSEGDSRDGNEGFHSEYSDIRGSFSHFKVPVKKQGQTISKGHKNYELMLNLQLGIRHSVGRPGPAISLDLKSSAFDPNEKLWTKFPPEGSKHTPPHQSCDFRWKDYCPLVFRTLRKLFNVDAADYMMSICGNDALRELSSPGKSGSFFYLTNDDRYMIKTMKKAEVKVLLRMLPAYYDHVKSFRNTLVTKFYGLHCVRLTGAAQKKVRFVIMGNLFCSEYAIHRRFDLKGSSHGRTTAKSESEIDPTTTLKDLDLNYIFRLQKLWFQEFCEQVDRDCDFLEQERIMDYSMLIGFHFQEVSSPSTSGAHTPIGDGNSDGYQFQFDSPSLSSISLGINMPARIEKTVRSDCETQLVGETTGELYEVILFFGIIDILQDYDISKKLEHAYKSMHYHPTSISAVDPKQYSKRFRDFIFKVFVEDS